MILITQSSRWQLTRDGPDALGLGKGPKVSHPKHPACYEMLRRV
jgi:hypothetical protein